MRAPKVVIEDRLTPEEKATLAIAINAIPTSLSPLEMSAAISKARQDAQKAAGYAVS
jgi:hypothetical protein